MTHMTPPSRFGHARRPASVPAKFTRIGSALFGAVALTVGSVSATAMADANPNSGPTSGGTTVTVSLPSFTSDRIAAGVFHTAAIAADGEIYSWGDNLYGELGTGLPLSPNPVPQQVVRPPGVDRWAAVFAGSATTFAIGEDPSQVFGWGANYTGGLGIGAGGALINHSEVPLAVDMSLAGGFTDIATDGIVALAIDLDGRIWGWGANVYGGLGIDDLYIPGVYSPMPLPLSPAVPDGLRFVDVEVASESSVLALGENGRLYAWGSNYDGHLGVGSMELFEGVLEVQLPPAVRIVSMAMGPYNGYAIDEDGLMWAWGAGAYGMLGDGTNQDQALPVQLLPPPGAAPGFGWTEVVVGGHVLARGNDGEWYAWGSNYFGQLADGTVDSRLAPERVLMPPGGFVAARAGWTHTILATECGLYSIGANDVGQLGNGTIVAIGGAPPVPTALEEVEAPFRSLELLGVEFDGVPGTNAMQIDCDTWQVDSPPHAEGVVDLQLTYQSGPFVQPTAVLLDGFTYGSAPAVTLDPLDASVGPGDDVTLTSAATGDADPTAQWQVSTDGGTIWTDVAGATSDTLVIAGVTSAQSGHRYRALYSNGLGTDASAAAAITVAVPPVPGPGPGPGPGPAPGPGSGGPPDSGAAPDVDTSLAVTGAPVVSVFAIAAGGLALAGAGLVGAHFIGRGGAGTTIRRP